MKRFTLETLIELKSLGVHVYIDNFGTGYSSFRYLRKFPFDRIKLDQSFVQQVPHDAESAAINRAIITMAKCLGMSTTVEGVETAEQLDFSVEAGGDTIQGYLISRPWNRAGLASFITAMSKAPHPSGPPEGAFPKPTRWSDAVILAWTSAAAHMQQDYRIHHDGILLIPLQLI